MKKSKEFIIKQDFLQPNTNIDLTFPNGVYVTTICRKRLARYFNIELKLGGRKRVKITIEEI